MVSRSFSGYTQRLNATTERGDCIPAPFYTTGEGCGNTTCSIFMFLCFFSWALSKPDIEQYQIYILKLFFFFIFVPKMLFFLMYTQFCQVLLLKCVLKESEVRPLCFRYKNKSSTCVMSARVQEKRNIVTARNKKKGVLSSLSLNFWRFPVNPCCT